MSALPDFTGWLVVNHFVHAEKFDTFHALVESAAEAAGLRLLRKTNVELLGCIDRPEEWFRDGARPDFVLFWDKDVVLARALENAGIRVFNPAAGIEVCDHKALTALALAGRGVPQPRTIPAPKTFRPDRYPTDTFLADVGAKLGFPLVVKECFGSFGLQVYLARDLSELREIVANIGTRPMLFQEFIASSEGRDVRIQVVGDRVVTAVLRTAKAGDFRANVTNGGAMRAYDPTPEQAELALKVCRLLRLDFAGVDILFGPGGAPILCEVNTNAHYKNLLDATGVDTGPHIMAHIRKVLQHVAVSSQTGAGAHP